MDESEKEKMEVLEAFHTKDTETIEQIKEELKTERVMRYHETEFLKSIIKTLQICIKELCEEEF